MKQQMHQQAVQQTGHETSAVEDAVYLAQAR